MDYTQSDANVVDPSTGHRMHQSTSPVTTEVSSDDVNGLTWEAVELIKAAGLAPAAFDKTMPATYSQVRDAVAIMVRKQSASVASATGSADALIGDYAPVVPALVNGLKLCLHAASVNATTAPTFTPNSIAVPAKTIVKGNDLPLVAGDIAGAGHWIELQYDLTLDKWVLNNPATFSVLAAPTGASWVGFTTADAIPVLTTVEEQLQKSITGNEGRSHFQIGAIPRCTAGIFSLIDDAAHRPLNVASVTQPDAFSIRVTYAKTAAKINTFVVGADDALAPYGVIFGGDVGTSYANILAFAPFDFYCDHNTPTPFIVLNALWAPSVAAGGIVASKPNAATTRVVHPASVANDAVVATIVGGSALLTPVVSFSSSQVDITMHSDAQGLITYDGAAWGQILSDNLTAPTLTWTAGNTLKVDHGVTGTINKAPLVTGQGGNYLPQVTNMGDTFFEVSFYDYAGVKITAPNTGFQFWYRREILVPTTWPDALIVSVKRGLCQVPSANFSSVAGNNLWVSGTMEG